MLSQRSRVDSVEKLMYDNKHQSETWQKLYNDCQSGQIVITYICDMNKGTADITVSHAGLDIVIVAMTGDTLLDCCAHSCVCNRSKKTDGLFFKASIHL